MGCLNITVFVADNTASFDRVLLVDFHINNHCINLNGVEKLKMQQTKLCFEKIVKYIK